MSETFVSSMFFMAWCLNFAGEKFSCFLPPQKRFLVTRTVCRHRWAATANICRCYTKQLKYRACFKANSSIGKQPQTDLNARPTHLNYNEIQK